MEYVRLCIAIIFKYHLSIVHINETNRRPPTCSHHISHVLRLLYIGLKQTLPNLKVRKNLQTHHYIAKSTHGQHPRKANPTSLLHITGTHTNLCLDISGVIVFGMCAQEMDRVELDLILALLHSWLVEAIACILLVLYFSLWNTLEHNMPLLLLEAGCSVVRLGLEDLTLYRQNVGPTKIKISPLNYNQIDQRNQLLTHMFSLPTLWVI